MRYRDPQKRPKNAFFGVFLAFLAIFSVFLTFLGFFGIFGVGCDRLEIYFRRKINFGNYASVAHERPNRRSSIGATIILAVLGFF